MNIILQAAVVMYGITFRADIAAFGTFDACNDTARAMVGPNWELSCREKLPGQVWSNGVVREFEACSWDGRPCRR